MGWNENTQLTSGKWSNWTQTWETGVDIWGASDMTTSNSRYTIVGGILYAQGAFRLGPSTNFGNGADLWKLWIPPEFGPYIDWSTGGRILGDGIIWGDALPWPAWQFQLRAINLYSTFLYMSVARNEGGPGQQFNGGADTLVNLSRSSLSLLGAPLICSFKMQFITDPTS